MASKRNPLLSAGFGVLFVSLTLIAFLVLALTGFMLMAVGREYTSFILSLFTLAGVFGAAAIVGVCVALYRTRPGTFAS